MDLTDSEENLLQTLRSLHSKLRDDTSHRYHRINPFYEDLFDWKERGKYWTGHDNVTVYNSCTIVGDVRIGEHTWIGPYVALDGTAGISIGRHCSISTGVQVLTHDTVRWCLSGGIDPYDYAPVSIGDQCFVGSHAVILKGITIGRCCVIGAGAVVTADVPEYSVVTGVPARRAGRVEFDSSGSASVVMEGQSR